MDAIDQPFPFITPGNDDTGIPDHVGQFKKLHSKTGYNLAISPVDGKFIVGGKMDTESDGYDILYFPITSDEVGEVRIYGQKSQCYVAMNDEGKVYAERAEIGKTLDSTVFIEAYLNGWNSYQSKINKLCYLGIKKNGKVKNGIKTAAGQGATLFLPRPV